MLLNLIILKKILLAILLFFVSLSAMVGSFRYDELPLLVQQLSGSNQRILLGMAQKGMAAGPERLEQIAIFSGIYACLISLAAIGTFRKKAWGEKLLLTILVISVPFELMEVSKNPSILSVVVMLLTLLGCLVVGQQVFKRGQR
jgi:uncharacterized membrane protein (DUF2068 family)